MVVTDMSEAIKNLVSNPTFQLCAAKAALKIVPRLSWGNTAAFSQWADVKEILSRDLDFIIEPVNKERIERVNGPFVLGLDRSNTHLYEREVLYGSLSPDDIPHIKSLALEHAKAFLEDVPKGQTIDVVNGYARRVASRSASALMGVDGPSEEDQMRVARAMFHELFLNLGGDKKIQDKAVECSQELRQWVVDNIKAQKTKKGSQAKENMIARMVSLGIDEDLIRRNVSGMFVGAIDTIATCVAQIMDVLLKRPKLRDQIIKDIDNPEKMRGWCYDALRFWPHNPLILRQAARDCKLGKKEIKEGTTVVCFTLAAMHDPAAFPDPSKVLPDRPLENYLHFGGGLHPCAGRAINGVQIPVLVAELLRRDPVIKGTMKHDGPFPDELTLKLQS
tara:strand:+ start:2756 stop:3928 length:1173 start_codon:yes stop_codon:yes gene_type:complete